MLRQYSKTLILITTAALLFLGDFAIELLAPDVGKLIEQDPRLKHLLWGLLLFCLAAAVFLFVREHNAPASHAEATADALFATEADQANRRAMLRLVRRNWVEGVLHKSLWNEVRLILNLEGRPDAVVRPCDLALRRAGQPDTYIQPGTSILEVYQQEQKELLLLGEPGSGKTTLLLEIAETLLEEAENNPTLPIPVVFNLSAWRKNHTRLDEWLVEQLNRDYGIPEKIGRRWVDGGAFLLLLDGLDEVAESRRAACVEAINEYRLKHQKVLRPMAVCCRMREYDEIPDLRLGYAVVIQPLTRQQVDGYLNGGGKALAGLRAVLKDEPALYRELFGTPLMLHVAVITYEDQPAAALRRSATLEERRRRLWDAYIERMFERKQEEEPLYEKAQALDWLAWMGSYLTRKDLQKYLIEGMQPNDLPRPWQPFLVRWLPSILLGGILSLVLYPGSYLGKTMLMLASVCALYSREIVLEPIRRFTIRNLRRRRKYILIRMAVGAAVGAAVGVVLGAVFLATDGAAGGAVLGAVAVAATVAARSLFEESVLEDTIRPNEGIRHSLGTAAFYSAFFAAFFAAGGAAVYALGGAVVLAAVGGATGAVLFGGTSAFQHYLLRLLLWRSGRFPPNITMFLDWTAQRVLVQRVGGGWRFVHRTLQERFAESYDEKYPDERRQSLPAENLPTATFSDNKP